MWKGQHTHTYTICYWMHRIPIRIIIKPIPTPTANIKAKLYHSIRKCVMNTMAKVLSFDDEAMSYICHSRRNMSERHAAFNSQLHRDYQHNIYLYSPHHIRIFTQPRNFRISDIFWQRLTVAFKGFRSINVCRLRRRPERRGSWLRSVAGCLCCAQRINF